MRVRVEEAGWGVMLPSFDPLRTGHTPVAAAARAAEDLGFDTGWVGDHLCFHPPVLDALTALGVAAGATERLSLGTGVLLLPLRHPVWTAKQVGTLSALAGPRILLGVGVGGENAVEWEAAGVPHRDRGRRLDEALDVIGPLLRGRPVEHDGPLLPVRAPVLEPVPTSPPPLVVGGRSDAALRRAARAGDGWLSVWMSPERLRAARARLAALAVEHGRPTPSVIHMVFVHVTDDHAAGRREAAAFVTGQYGLQLERLERWLVLGDRDEVAAALVAFRDAGADGFVLVPAAADVVGQFHRLAEVRHRVDRARAAGDGGRDRSPAL